jgi:dTDP-4-amino-4,6-dideoxygalactose transaminase
VRPTSALEPRHARLRLDLGWGDLAFALASACVAGARARTTARIERSFSEQGDACVALSARSGFDAYLRALSLPAGSEVLVSGLTIPHMVQILAAHGLRAVPFGLDPSTLAPAPGEIERRATPRTRAVLFAHLFGQRAELGPLVALARRRRWLVWEDCAQAFTGDAWRGHPEADLALFSFGLIKTCTAVQGGILRVRDSAVRERMAAVQAAWPLQPRTHFLGRAFKAAALHALEQPWLFERFTRACARRGKDLDEVLHRATRGFPGPDFLPRLRRRPSAPLLALLERRLRRPRRSLAGARRAAGEALLGELAGVEVFGRGAAERHHWVFAVGCDEPARLVRDLRAAGYDATARSSLIAIEPSGGGEPPAACRELLERLVYVPLVLRARPEQRAALVRILRDAARAFELQPHPARTLAPQRPTR